MSLPCLSSRQFHLQHPRMSRGSANQSPNMSSIFGGGSVGSAGGADGQRPRTAGLHGCVADAICTLTLAHACRSNDTRLRPRVYSRCVRACRWPPGDGAARKADAVHERRRTRRWPRFAGIEWSGTDLPRCGERPSAPTPRSSVESRRPPYRCSCKVAGAWDLTRSLARVASGGCRES